MRGRSEDRLRICVVVRRARSRRPLRVRSVSHAESKLPTRPCGRSEGPSPTRSNSPSDTPVHSSGNHHKSPNRFARPSASIRAIARTIVAFGHVPLERTNIPSSPCQTAPGLRANPGGLAASPVARDPNPSCPGYRRFLRSARPSQGRSKSLPSVPALTTSQKWWRRTGLNRRPPACKAGALPLSYAPEHVVRCPGESYPE
jgi:hypothetical protein